MRANLANARSSKWLLMVLVLSAATLYLHVFMPSSVVEKSSWNALKPQQAQPVSDKTEDSEDQPAILIDDNTRENVSKLKQMAEKWKRNEGTIGNARLISIWPKPKMLVQNNDKSFTRISNTFNFGILSLDITLADVEQFISSMDRTIRDKWDDTLKCRATDSATDHLDVLYIEIEKNQDPKSEEYDLIIGKHQAYLSAKTKLGVIRGLNSFMQLVHGSLQSDNWCEHLRVPAELFIHDEPAYGHRGLLLDTARNYYSVEFVKKVIRTLSMLKMNILHWHLSDDESFGLQSVLFPDLTDIRDPDLKFRFYTQNEIREIVAEANKWGVRIIPEIDMPGHTGSWFNQPNVLAKCPVRACVQSWGLELNPYSADTWNVIKGLLSELTALFPGSPLHLGGDEVTHMCWAEDPALAAHPASKHTKWQHFEHELYKIVEELPSNPSVIRWQESAPFKSNSTKFNVWFQIWMHPGQQTIEKWAVSSTPLISSLGWYLDNQCMTWKQCYEANPLAPIVRAKQNAQTPLEMLGFEACAWELPEEAYGTENIWARLVAIGDRMWTGEFGVGSDHEVEQGLIRTCRILAKEWQLFPEFLCTTDSLNKRASTPGNILEFPKRRKKRDTQICARMNRYSQTTYPCTTHACTSRN